MERRVRVWRLPFLCCRRVAGVREAWPRPGDVGGGRWVFVRVRHHGLLRLASTIWVSSPLMCPTDRRCWSVLRGRALLGCTRGSFWAGLARLGSSWFMADSSVIGVTSIAGSSGGMR